MGLIRSLKKHQRAAAAGILIVAIQPAGETFFIELSSGARQSLDAIEDAALSPEAHSDLARVFDGALTGKRQAGADVLARFARPGGSGPAAELPTGTLGPLATPAPAPVVPEPGAEAATAAPPSVRASLGTGVQILTVGWKGVTTSFSANVKAHAGKAVANAVWSVFTLGLTAGLAAVDPLYHPNEPRVPTAVALHRGEEGDGHVLVRAGAGTLIDRLVEVAGFTPSQAVVVLKDSAASGMTALRQEALLTHELVHTRQFRESYAADFLYEYFRLKAQYGYRDNPKEREAYDVEADFLCARGDAAACQDPMKEHSHAAPDLVATSAESRLSS